MKISIARALAVALTVAVPGTALAAEHAPVGTQGAKKNPKDKGHTNKAKTANKDKNKTQKHDSKHVTKRAHPAPHS